MSDLEDEVVEVEMEMSVNLGRCLHRNKTDHLVDNQIFEVCRDCKTTLEIRSEDAN